MLYTICIWLILVASVLIILAVLVQNPKSGMAANFGAANSTIGVRGTADFLEKFTWTMAIAIVALSLLATVAAGGAHGSSNISKDLDRLPQQSSTQAIIPQVDIQADEAAPAEE
ncbi:MAG: preprotein translocase subunit SecG [Alistipes sp.]|nr:preprotein translocase subunit SecG [Alistipes sp.]